MRYIKWFEDLTKEDVPLAGGKGANLGEMTRAGLPVPPGYVVTADAWRRFVQASCLTEEIPKRLAGLDVDDPRQLQVVSRAIQDTIRRSPVPDDVRGEIVQAYQELGKRTGLPDDFVSVRSSATVEDTERFSFAGLFRSFLNVRGPEALVRHVREVWASLYEPRVIFYRVKGGLPEGRQEIAVIVQKMVNADKSGVLFTVDPATNDPRVEVIEAAWGLGEVVVGGEITPDRYVVDKASLQVLERMVGRKDVAIFRDPHTGENVRVSLPPEKATAQVLAEDEIRALADLGKRDEDHYGIPQDAEWAIEQKAIYLVQTRPVTTLARRPPPAEMAPPQAEVLLRGLGASPGIASGPVKVLLTPEEGDKLQPGDILATVMTAPDWVPLMRRAAAIVTDAGGMTSHAAIVSRELGVPCIVGTRNATRTLKDGMVVTVNATEGVVLRGAVAPPQPAPTAAPAMVAPAPIVTATKLYVNLGEPEKAEEVARQPVDGVGLLRAEFMMLSALEGKHPRLLLEQGKGEEFVDRMAAQLRRFARAFHPRPVIYRAMDFKTNEFRDLQGGDRFEPREANPMLGYRGAFRYIREPDLFLLEIEAIKKVRTEFKNLHLMVPFVRTAWEFRECKALIDQSGLSRDRELWLWVMAEVPSIVHWLPEYARLGVNGVSIGSNDLTQLVLGVDRDNELVAPLYDERDRAVLETIHAIIRECRRTGITSSICGQAPSVHPEYAEVLVSWGINSISVNPDVIDVTRRHIAAAEQKVILAKSLAD